MGCFTSFYDWSKTLGASLSTNHIDRKLKPITTLSHALARTLGSLLVFTLNLTALKGISPFFRLALSDNFSFGFKTLNPKALHLCRVFFLSVLLHRNTS